MACWPQPGKACVLGWLLQPWAVEHTANAFLKPKSEQQVDKEKVEDHGAKSIMACLAGKSACYWRGSWKSVRFHAWTTHAVSPWVATRTMQQQNFDPAANSVLAECTTCTQHSLWADFREKAIPYNPEDHSSKCGDYPCQLIQGRHTGKGKGPFQEAACEESLPCTAGHVAQDQEGCSGWQSAKTKTWQKGVTIASLASTGCRMLESLAWRCLYQLCRLAFLLVSCGCMLRLNLHLAQSNLEAAGALEGVKLAKAAWMSLLSPWLQMLMWWEQLLREAEWMSLPLLHRWVGFPICIESNYKSLATCRPIPAADVVVNSYIFNSDVFFCRVRRLSIWCFWNLWGSNPFLGPCCKSTPCSITSSGANRAQVRSRWQWSGERKQRLLAEAVWKTERSVFIRFHFCFFL